MASWGGLTGFLCLDPSVDRDDRSFGRDRNRDSDKTDTDWRARPAQDSMDDYPPRRGDDSFGDSEFVSVQWVSSVFQGWSIQEWGRCVHWKITLAQSGCRKLKGVNRSGL